MKVLIDTNVLLDVLSRRKAFYAESAAVFKLCETRQLDGYISALSVPNIVYIMRKELDVEKTNSILGFLMMIFSISDLTKGCLLKAQHKGFRDFEDAIQVACAEQVGAKFIITRNVKDFESQNAVTALTPAEFLSFLNAELIQPKEKL